MDRIYCYAGWLNNEKIGTIYKDIINGNEVISFEYDRIWLAEHPGLMLDPTIPLSPYRTYSADKELFGCFQDSSPDRWGQKLIERKEAEMADREGRARRHFFNSDYMLKVEDRSRQGGFRFKTDENGIFLDKDEQPIPPIASIRELEQISLGYENQSDNRWITMLVEPGSSLGGARPKATVVNTDGSLWMAKFPSKNDTYDVGAWEKVAYDLAAACGINVSRSELRRFSDLGSTFLTERFDRNGNTRIHFASAMTMLGARDGNADKLGFLDLAETVDRITANPDKQLEELFRRVVFDVAISNHDDHLRNHGFLLLDNKWSLSQAYDLNPVSDQMYLEMNIDTDDGYRSFDKVLSTCDFYHLDTDRANKIISHMSRVITSEWPKLASRYGIRESDKKMMAPAFELAALKSNEND